MRQRGLSFVSVVSAIVVLVSAQPPPAHSRAVVIGIHLYPSDILGMDQLQFAHQDARLFDSFLQAGYSGNFVPDSIARVGDDNGNRAFTRSAMRRILLGALPGETVFVFVSARGLAYPEWRDGYLSTTDTKAERPEDTAISVSELKAWVTASRASRVYLFADVCRQSTRRIDNRINIRLEDLARVRNKSFEAVLATDSKQESEENPALKSAVGQGHGVFSYFLVNGMNGAASSAGGVSWSQLVSYLAREQKPPNTHQPQRPKLFGTLNAAENVISNAGARRTSLVRLGEPEPVLVAASGRVPLGILFQIAQARAGCLEVVS